MIDLRIKQKKDTESNWISANPILLDGEIILVETESRVRVKIGDGSSEYSSLPFIDSDLYTEVSRKAYIDSLSSVAITGDYSDLRNIPRIEQLHVASTEGTSVIYTANIPSITELFTGLVIVVVPHVSSTTTSASLNINNLGAKQFRRVYSDRSARTAHSDQSFLRAGDPTLLMYDGEYWITILSSRPISSDLSGTISVSNGGTGRGTLTANSYLIGNSTGQVTLKTPTEVRDHIGASPNDHEHSFMRDRLVVSGDTVTSISIPESVSYSGREDGTHLLVYQNGLLLEQDIHYTYNVNTISLIDTYAKSGDIFSFVRINTPE